MASLENLVPQLPRRKRKTFRIWPEVEDYLESLPGTQNGQVNSKLLALARQERKIPGIGPRTLPDFCAVMGIESTLPPEYQYTAKERFMMRREEQQTQIRMVGAPLNDPEVSARIKEDTDRFFLDRTKTTCKRFDPSEDLFFQKSWEARWTKVKEAEHPISGYFAKPPQIKDLPPKSEKLARLVTLALQYCPQSLEFACREAVGTTLDALERKIEVLVELYGPAPQKPGRRHLKRDSS